MNVIVKSKWKWEMRYSRKKTNGGLRRYFFNPTPPSGIFKFFTLPLEIP